MARSRPLSLLSKILLSTSIFITLLLGVTGWLIQDQVLRAMLQSMESQMQGNFRAYDSLWRARAEMLGSVSLVLSNMSDVRAAFRTADAATIRDTATELWTRVSQTNAFFMVADPQGNVIASLGGAQPLGARIPAVEHAARNFPAQTSGFVLAGGRLYQLVVTPVYVESARGPALINVLAAGYVVDDRVAADLKTRTGGSDFVFVAGMRPLASTLDAKIGKEVAAHASGRGFERVTIGGDQYAAIGSVLNDLEGLPVGELLIVRSFATIRARIASLERGLIITWAAAILAGLAGSFLVARRLLNPVRELDRAAARIADREYSTRVSASGSDELGRLAGTFNAMCESLQRAERELIRQERINTIGRLSSSIVHDLRNPLAAIYGGAEMLMDAELSPTQVKRLAANIYRSSRNVKDLLQELVDVSRKPGQPSEVCRLHEVVDAAIATQTDLAEANHVEITNRTPGELELPLERARMERVFMNLVSNAIEAMPEGGKVAITAEEHGTTVLVSVEDSGPGIPESLRPILFQPFATAGKKYGLGLGLAMSRQTVLDHGGDVWADTDFRGGAKFWIRLPLAK